MRAARIPSFGSLVFVGLVVLAASVLSTALRADDAPAPAAPAGATKPEPTTRWYEHFRQGQKIGWSKVTWSVSTWNGKPTVHDRTENLTRTVRDMAGHKDVFQSRSVYEIERDEDGTLWWLKAETVEAGRRSLVEYTWTGKGYDTVEVVEDQEKKVVVPLDAPVSVDLEARLSKPAREGALAKGQKLELRELDVEGRRARVREIEVLGTEETESAAGPVETVKVVLRYPETRSEEWMWIDREGAFVRTRGDTGGESRRATEEKATRLPRTAPSFAITAKSHPPLERVMSADRLWVDVRLAADPERKLPDLPDSPWSKAGAPVEEEGGGWRIPVVLTAYDDPTAKATLPVDRARFARELESTPLMPCGHPNLLEVVQEAVGDEKDARKVAYLLARWVHEHLAKGSPDVAEASALQILEERRGDCSEHGLLYTALCRAAGVPARRCSGWVNIGSDWGGHAWTEVWVGAWVGADPTTGEVGTGARYLFFGYPDDPDSYPGVASARIAGRISLTATRIEEDGVAFDLAPTPEGNVLTGGEGAGRWWLHAASGLEARGLPEGWSARLVPHRRAPRMEVKGPGLTCKVLMEADQGRILDFESDETFAGVPAVHAEREGGRIWMLQSRRRVFQVDVDTQDEAQIALLQRILAPTFAPKVTDPRTTPPEVAAGPLTPLDRTKFIGAWTLDRESTLAGILVEGRRAAPDVDLAELETHSRDRLNEMKVSLLLEADGTFLLSVSPPRVVTRGTWSVGGSVRLKSDASEEPLDVAEDGTFLHVLRGGDTLVLRRADPPPR